MTSAQKITPCLWFNFNAEEAVEHYLSIFKNSRTLTTTGYGEAGPGPVGAVMTCLFEIEGQQYLALNGGPQFSFNQAISLIVNCDTQDEVDELWEKLGADGKPNQCGWLSDKFGVSWQIVPRAVPEMLLSGHAAQTQRMMRAIFGMKKLDIAKLRQAFGPNQEEDHGTGIHQ
jgi:predicted 3-demethylubiquinone-9 3-methyltransferase (glyoxalase superfamily)